MNIQTVENVTKVTTILLGEMP